MSRPGSYFTLQLLGTREENTLRRFVSRHALDGAAYYRTDHGGGDWFVLLYGEYGDRQAASEAIAALPPEVRENAPWPRTLDSVQQAIQAAR